MFTSILSFAKTRPSQSIWVRQVIELYYSGRSWDNVVTGNSLIPIITINPVTLLVEKRVVGVNQTPAVLEDETKCSQINSS